MTEEKEKIEETPEEITPEQEIESLTNSMKRLQADFDNFRRRTQEESSKIRQTANEGILKEFLSINDNIEAAIEKTPEDQRNDFYDGIKIIHKQISEMMKNQGLEKIKHEEFNANLHEALLTESSDKPKNAITEVLHQGYVLAGKVLRPSKVKLSNGGKQNE